MDEIKIQNPDDLVIFRFPKYIMIGFVGLVFLLVVTVIVLFLPPRMFPVGNVVSVERGATLSSISKQFKEKHLVNSATLLRFLVSMMGSDRSIEAGDYVFDKPQGLLSVATRLSRADHGVGISKITIPEGLNSKEISIILSNKLANFNSIEFIKESTLKEGYLFPDTYFFGVNSTSSEVIARMEENFNVKTAKLQLESKKREKLFKDIVIMASILEKEVKTSESRTLVSGILWKRISIGMPLQVDATLGFITGRGSIDLTTTDLNIDSPYNTYRFKGLPKGPIGNPGVEAIEAAMNPKASPYLYYLSDKEGNIHYAETFEEHKANKAKYIR